MKATPLDAAGRWWRINGGDIDLNAEAFIGLERAAVLALRDAVDDEGSDVAALLEAGVDAGEMPGAVVAVGWLFKQTQRIVDRMWSRIDRIEGRYHNPSRKFAGALGPAVDGSVQRRADGCHEACPCRAPGSLPSIQQPVGGGLVEHAA
jgi:hypothetical protein